MFVFDYLLSMFAQYYVYPIDYDKTNSYGVVMGRAFPQKKKLCKDFRWMWDSVLV